MHGLLVYKFPSEEYNRMVKELLKKKGYNDTTFDEWKSKYGTISAAMEENNMRDEYLRLLDNVPVSSEIDLDIVKLIKRSDQKVYLASNSSRRNTMKTLHGIGLSMCDFNYIITGDDVSHSKPSIEMYETLLKISKVKPEEIMVFGDRETDIIPAKKLGMNGMVCTYEEFKPLFRKICDENDGA